MEWSLAGLAGVAMSLTVLGFSVIAHEIAHGYVAYRLGDDTALRANRLNFNPLNHLDPVGSVILPLILVLTHSPVFLAWAKPVPVNPGNFRHPRRDDTLVSIAGVAVNMFLAVTAAVILRLAMFAHIQNSALVEFLFLLCSINVGLAVFNMVPIPPLDGSHVMSNILPPEAARVYGRIAEFGLILLLVFIGTGLLSVIISPIIHSIIWLLLIAGA